MHIVESLGSGIVAVPKFGKEDNSSNNVNSNRSKNGFDILPIVHESGPCRRNDASSTRPLQGRSDVERQASGNRMNLFRSRRKS